MDRSKGRAKRLGVTLAVGVLLLVAGGCGGDSSDGGGDSAGSPASRSETIPELKWGMLNPPVSLDVAQGLDQGSVTLSYVAVSSLLRWHTDGSLQGEIAESWEQVSPTELVFQLRPEARFTDGKPVTAEDVVFSIERNLKPDSNVSGYLHAVESVEATGEHEVTIKLSVPDPSVPPYLTYPMIIQKEYALAHKKDLGTTGGIVSATPYKVESFTPNVGGTLTRVDDYWGEAPPVEKITFETVADVNALQLALQSGQIDGAFDLPLTEASVFDAQSAFKTSYAPAPVMDFLSFDLKTKPFDDIHVRKAIAHAIDREALVDSIFDGHAHVLRSIVMPPLLTGDIDESEIEAFEAKLPDYPFDLDKAREELAQSAYPDGFTVDAPFSSTAPQQSLILQALAENLKPLGIIIKPKALPRAQYIGEAYAHKDLGLRIFNFLMLPNAPTVPLDTMLNPENARPNGLNLANVTDQEIDKLRLEYNAATSAEERTRLLEDILTRVGEMVPYAPMFYQDGGAALSTKYEWASPFSHYIRRELFPMYLRTAG